MKYRLILSSATVSHLWLTFFLARFATIPPPRLTFDTTSQRLSTCLKIVQPSPSRTCTRERRVRLISGLVRTSIEVSFFFFFFFCEFSFLEASTGNGAGSMGRVSLLVSRDNGLLNCWFSVRTNSSGTEGVLFCCLTRLGFFGYSTESVIFVHYADDCNRIFFFSEITRLNQIQLPFQRVAKLQLLRVSIKANFSFTPDQTDPKLPLSTGKRRDPAYPARG